MWVDSIVSAMREHDASADDICTLYSTTSMIVAALLCAPITAEHKRKCLSGHCVETKVAV